MERRKMMQSFAVLVWGLAAVSVGNAFVVVPPAASSNPKLQRYEPTTAATRFVLYMASEDDETDVEEPVAEDVAQEEEEPEEEEDPELVALKEEIAKLEADVKEKRRQVKYTQDRAEEFTKSGYARKVAEMENMRRARSMLNSSNKYTAMASSVAEFLPIYDKLMDLRSRYESDDFGSQYNALPGAVKTAFSELGVTEYTVAAGDVIDVSRMSVVELEHSDDQPADSVLRPLSLGLELQGNVIRAAECVGSLGPEATAEEEEEEAAEEEAAEEEASE